MAVCNNIRPPYAGAAPVPFLAHSRNMDQPASLAHCSACITSLCSAAGRFVARLLEYHRVICTMSTATISDSSALPSDPDSNYQPPHDDTPRSSAAQATQQGAVASPSSTRPSPANTASAPGRHATRTILHHNLAADAGASSFAGHYLQRLTEQGESSQYLYWVVLSDTKDKQLAIVVCVQKPSVQHTQHLHRGRTKTVAANLPTTPSLTSTTAATSLASGKPPGGRPWSGSKHWAPKPPSPRQACPKSHARPLRAAPPQSPKGPGRLERKGHRQHHRRPRYARWGAWYQASVLQEKKVHAWTGTWRHDEGAELVLAHSSFPPGDPFDARPHFTTTYASHHMSTRHAMSQV